MATHEVGLDVLNNTRTIVPIFEYDVANRATGVLLIDLGQVTARSETVGLKPTSLQALYHSVNSSETDVFCEIAEITLDLDQKVIVTPGKLVKKDRPNTATEFSAVGLSLVNSNQMFDFFRVLDGANIPTFADQRTEEHPLVIVGGASVINPIPLGLFADIVVMGQAEQAMVEVSDIIARKDLSKADKLQAVSKIQGVYVPEAKGEIIDFAEINYPSAQYPPGSVMVVDGEASLVISRSCPHHCSMCRISSAETFQRKPFDQLVDHVKLLADAGAKQVAIVSASASAYMSEGKTLKDIIAMIEGFGLKAKFLADRPKLIAMAENLTSVVLAPEVSPRLRKEVLDKTIKESELRAAIDIGLAKGIKRFTFYSIIGIKDHENIKGETAEDLNYYLELAQYVNQKASESQIDGVSVEFSAMPLMPSPHTNLETHPMVTWEEFKNELFYLNNLAQENGLTNTSFITHLTELDFTLEAILNRGGVDEGLLCYEAYYVAKSKSLDLLSSLKQVMTKHSINISSYLSAKTVDQLLYRKEVQPVRRRWIRSSDSTAQRRAEDQV